MSVYVDDMYQYEIGQFTVGQRTMKMSHMIADTRDELLAMARTVGLDVRHIQKQDTPGDRGWRGSDHDAPVLGDVRAPP